jgi:hypothetical protein
MRQHKTKHKCESAVIQTHRVAVNITGLAQVQSGQSSVVTFVKLAHVRPPGSSYYHKVFKLLLVSIYWLAQLLYYSRTHEKYRSYKYRVLEPRKEFHRKYSYISHKTLQLLTTHASLFSW